MTIRHDCSILYHVCLHLLQVNNNFSLLINSAFLYNPYHGTQVAWTVANNHQQVVTDREDPLPFTTVFVNAGFAWDPQSNEVTCQNGGYYLVHLSFATIGERRAQVSVKRSYALSTNRTQN